MALLRREARAPPRARRTRRSSSSPTATTSTTSSSASSHAAPSCCARRRCRPRPRRTCASCCRSPPAASSSPRSRSSCPEERGDRFPLLTDRRNVVVIADEAHRSQYDFVDGFARHHPRRAAERDLHRLHRHPDRARRPRHPRTSSATTSTSTTSAARSRTARPCRSTTRAASPSSTSRGRGTPDARRGVRGGHRGRGGARRARSSSRSGRSSRRVVGTDKRLELVAADLVEHFERRLGGARRQGDDRLHEPAHLRRPLRRASSRSARSGTDDDDGGRDQGRHDRLGHRSARVAAAHPQRRRGARRSPAASRTPTTRSSIVIVRDMWLTGFDAPCLHTMYVDKPMRGHGLMQAIARVNRVFRDKPGGLVVDYLGIADDLQQGARRLHRERRRGRAGDRPGRGGRGACSRSYEICRDAVPRLRLLDVFDAARPTERLSLLPAAQEHVLAQEDGQRTASSQAVIDAVEGVRARRPTRRGAARSGTRSPSSRRCKAALPKTRGRAAATAGGPRPRHPPDRRRARSRPSEVIDIFAAAGSAEARHLDPLRRVPRRGPRACRRRTSRSSCSSKLLNDEIKTRSRRNVVQSRAFSEMLEAVAAASTRTGRSRPPRSSRS